MAYTQDWDETAPDGAVVLASDLDTVIKNLKISIRERLEDFFPDWDDDGVDPKTLARVKVSLTVNETIANGTATYIPWDQADYETNTALWDIATPTEVVIQDTGFYHINAQVSWDSGSTGNRTATLEAAGGTVALLIQAATGNDAQNVSWVGELSALDVVKLSVLHNNGASQDIIFGTSYLAVTKLA